MLVAGLLTIAPPADAPCLLPPVSGRVTDGFRSPVCPYCAGNRGLEIDTTPGQTVVAAAAGRVSFAGSVAGTRYVAVEHGGGYRTTYGGLASITVTTGTRVDAGGALGTSAAHTFFGLRQGDVYLDPYPHLGVVVIAPHLVPLDGSPGRPGGAGRLRCPPGRGGG